MANPKSMTVFQAEDRIGLIGDKEEIDTVEKLLTASYKENMSLESETQD